ncbi:C1 family peptidase [Pseudobacteriovorax antillogorgiicola]|uniref:Papain family cysteine protease n=1 Tax=Pseudobacteriovorax antillogorgiicola TaxID=1513793 RepID=A0A1Y6BF79_9BACT|nr:C1 family peptidase [Pseudobacteriovorax antillogorgiicola]TCS56372.1 papain like protease [Pseudobacteriovorax antillogorgiicola]SMF06557.1 Papain family cysteine protease [Pseudobacteriovorax antillogorgiicola]
MNRLSMGLWATVFAFSGQAIAEQEIEIGNKTIKLQDKPEDGYLNLDEPSSFLWMTDALPEVDLSQWQTPVKDQANRGSCAYFTSIALVEHALKVYYPDNRDVNLSEEYLIYANKKLDGISSNGDGSFLYYNLNSLKRHGFMLEESMPYTHSWFSPGMPCEDYEDNGQAPQFCRSHYAPSQVALDNRVASQDFNLNISQVRSMDEVIERLSEGQGVTISVPVNQNGWRSARVEHNQALEDECQDKPDLCGGHTVLLTGYNLDKREFYFKNSWGQEWGEQGYGIMPFEFVQNWSYGSFFYARFQRLNSDLRNQLTPISLENAEASLVQNVLNKGQAGIRVDFSFRFLAPVGTFYYASVFAQRKGEADSYQAIEIIGEDGASSYLSDREYRIAFTADDLSFSNDKPLSLFISYDELSKAGIDLNDPSIFLRPSVYSMTDIESYGVLYRDYLPIAN